MVAPPTSNTAFCIIRGMVGLSDHGTLTLGICIVGPAMSARNGIERKLRAPWRECHSSIRDGRVGVAIEVSTLFFLSLLFATPHFIPLQFFPLSRLLDMSRYCFRGLLLWIWYVSCLFMDFCKYLLVLFFLLLS